MFQWIAAGTGYHSFAGVSIYVRFLKRKGGFEEKAYPQGFFAKLSDREIFVTRPGNREYNFFLPFNNFDFCVDADLLGFDSAVEHTGIMFTYDPAKAKLKGQFDKSKTKFPIWADSGGFQLLGGKKQFIDPVSLAKWYNKFVNRGMTLDVPLFANASSDLTKQSARVQNLNTRIMLDNLESDITLYNISHGFTLEERKKFIDIVDNSRLNNWAIGCSYYGNVFDLIYNIFSVISYVKADAYHVFGIANTTIIPVLAWIGKYYNITSDSSTHLQSGRCSTIFTIIKHSLKKLAIGASAKESIHSNNEFPMIPCSCNICRAIGTTELTHYSNNSGLSHSCCILHNINIMAKYVKIWSNLAIENDLKEYKKLLKKVFPRKTVKYWSKAFDYIEAIRDIGFEKATQHFRADLTLFGARDVYPEDLNLFGAEEDSYSVNLNLTKRLLKVFKIYKEYHSDRSNFKFKTKKQKKKKSNKKFVVDKSKKKMGIYGVSKRLLKRRKRK